DGEVDPDYNEDDYSNYDIDPNIELSEEQIPVQSHLKYPDKDSPDDFWVLPSGKSIDIIIRAPKNLHKSQQQKDWDYLNSSVDYPHYDLSTEIEDLFIVLLDTIYLKASANQRLLRRNLKPDDDKPLGMKVDGSFQFPDERGLEIGMVELSGGYLTNDLPRYLKDHVKGYWGCRDLLNDVITNFNHDDTLKVLEEFKRSHRRNTLLRFQSIALKNYIGDAKSSPQKPTGKKSRIINPVEHHMHHDHDDSDYDDPPSPSPSGHSRYPHQLNSD
ncbi:9749_t:CDS:2, partial [Racocetra fulgida]